MPPAPASGSAASPPEPTDSVFTRARRGDTRALGSLLGRWLPVIQRWAHGRLSRAAHAGVDTGDVVQDAFVQVVPRLDSGQFDSEQALAAYLRKVVANRIHDEHRRIARRGPHDGESPDLAGPGPSPLDEVLARETEASYRAALARLRPADRELIVAHIELGYSHEQLGLMSARTPNAARVALQRATRRLLDLMLHE